MPRKNHRLIQITAAAIVLIVAGRGILQRLASPVGGSNQAAAATSTPVESHSDPAEEIHRPSADSDSSMSEPASLDDPVSTLLGLGLETVHTVSSLGNDLLDELAGLTIEEELAIGLEADRETRSRHRVVNDPVQQARIERLAAPFLKARERQRIGYRFAVLDEGSVNAFAILGGSIYIHRGLLEALHSDDELRFVLGHEIAHVDRRHCVKSMTAILRTQQAAGGLGATLAGLAYQAVALGYSEDLEFEADAWSYRQMRRQGIARDQCLSGLLMLQRAFGSDGDGRSRSPTAFEHVENHFRSHPRLRDRLDRLKNQEP